MKPILVVDDDEDDIYLMRMACQRSGFPHSLHVVTSGQEAKDYLAGIGQYSNRTQFPLPHLVFLDIKMPGLDGHNVLKWIRAQPGHMNLPVIMLTTSHEKSDIDRAYTLGVNSYLCKGADLVEFAQGVRIILKYWLEMNLLPGFSA